jgi:hypothetical protein
MFDTPLSDRVARLNEAYEDAKSAAIAAPTDLQVENIRDELAVRKLALLKVEQALLVAGF